MGRGKLKDQLKFGAIWLDFSLVKEAAGRNAAVSGASASSLGVLKHTIPPGRSRLMRDEALKQDRNLDCGNPSKYLASCDPDAETPPEVLDLAKKLAAARVDDAAFAKALATELGRLFCASDANAIHILRGAIKSGWTLAAPGPRGSRPCKFHHGQGLSGFRLADRRRQGEAAENQARRREKIPASAGIKAKRSEPATGPSHARLRAPAMRSDRNPRQNYQRSISSLLKDLCTLKPLKHFLLLPPLITLFVKISRAVATTHIACCEPFKALMAV